VQLGLTGPNGREIDVGGYERVPALTGRRNYTFPILSARATVSGWTVYSDSGEVIVSGRMTQGPLNLGPGDTIALDLDLPEELAPPPPEPPPPEPKVGAPWWERLAEDLLVGPVP